jgi:hypothetical protein
VNRFLAPALLVASLLCGCSHLPAPHFPIRFSGRPLGVLLIDLIEDNGWGGRTRVLVAYTGSERTATVVVSGRKTSVHRIPLDRLRNLVQAIDDSACMSLQTPDNGAGCEDCPSWDVLLRLDQAQNHFTFTDPKPPDCVRRILDLVRY